MISGIYKFTSPDGKIYVGQAKDIEARFNQHKWGVKFVNDRFKAVVDKFGFDAISFEILCECPIHDLNDSERHYQDLFDVCGENGLNCRLTPTSDKPIFIRPETLEKMGAPKRGRKFSEEHKTKIGASKVGKKRDPELFKRIVANRKPQVFTEERRKLISDLHKGHKYNNGRVHSEELKAREKIQLDAIRRLGGDCHNAKLLLCTERGIYFETLKDAAIAHNINPVTLNAMMKGRNRNRTSLVYA